MIAGIVAGGIPATLDSHATGLWAAFSIAKLLGTSSSSLNAINTTSSATATIGFASDGGLDTAALATLAGANSVAVSALINQEGTTARNLGAGTASLRPAIVSAGSYLGSVQFDGSSDGMVSGANSGTPTAFTVFLRGKLRSASGTQTIIEQSTNYNSGAFCATFLESGGSAVSLHSGASASNNYTVSTFSSRYPNDNVQCYRWDRSQATSANRSALLIDGIRQTRSGSTESGTPGANFGSAPWYVGARAQASVFAQLNLHTLLIYERAVPDAEAAQISSIIAALR